MQAVITTLNTYKAQMQGILKRHDCSVVDCADIVQRIQFVRKQDCINAEITNLVVNLKEQAALCFNYGGSVSLAINANVSFVVDRFNKLNAIRKHEINILAFGGSCSNCHYCWHFDQDDSSAKKNLLHPYYHMHCGGRGIKDKNSGEILLFKAPRIAYPPMDPFLCLHFIFHNFCERKCYPKFENIFNDNDYKTIIKFSQDMFWEPYFNGFSAESSHEVFNRNKLFPMFV